MPICGEDNIPKGLIANRDIVVKVIAAANDPRAVHVGELARGEAVTVGADDSAEDMLEAMRRHQIRRLPPLAIHRWALSSTRCRSTGKRGGSFNGS